MNLIIDVGNTLSKLAVFDHEEMIFLERYENLQVKDVDSVLQAYPLIRAGMIGSVGHLNKAVPDYLEKHIRLHCINPDTRLPIHHEYTTLSTLGADRIAAVVAANRLYPGRNILVIETGTCITYDFIDGEGVYHGGSISPGIALRYSALHNFTANLPLLVPVSEAGLIGNSTENSIHSGVINGLKAELNGIISMYERNYEYLTIILSGGDLESFDKNLKNNIFAVPNIVLSGLNIILEFNDKN